MRFLADAGISPKTVEFLETLGYEVAHVRSLDLQRASDAEIVQHAVGNAEILLTFDLDFGDILALGSLNKPSVILFRLSTKGPTPSIAGWLRCWPNANRTWNAAR